MVLVGAVGDINATLGILVPGFGIRSEVSENVAADRDHVYGALTEMDRQSVDVVRAQTLFPFLEFDGREVNKFSGTGVGQPGA
jgi:hypothetical protein